MMLDFTRWAVTWQRWRVPRTAPPTIKEGEVVIGYGEGAVPIIWPAPSPVRASHGLVFSASGTGKTQMFAAATAAEFCLSDCPLEKRHALLGVDGKGDYIKAFLSGVAALRPERLVDVRVLDPFAALPFAFNLKHLARGGNTPLEVRSLGLANLAATVSTGVGTQAHLGAGSRQIDVIQNCLLAPLASPDPRASPLWALDGLIIPQGLKCLAAITDSERAKQFLLSAQLSEELRASCAGRLRLALAASESLERMMSAPTCVQFSELLGPGRACLVDLGRPTGGLSVLTRFFANLIVRLAVEYLLERPSPYPGHHVRLFADEAHLIVPILSDCCEAIETTGRSRNVSLALCTQSPVLLDEASDSLVPVLLGNTPFKVIGRMDMPSAVVCTLYTRHIAPPLRSAKPSIYGSAS
ncbi:MAG: ATP-binding protein [Candidatus Magasanikbacteria bacterium]|nr:ATP-binding protein [Candidatus Magasanikbacteria bacterium]